MRGAVVLVLTAALFLTLATTFLSAGIDCKSDCTCMKCCVDGSCPDGRWSGTVCGCGEGDPALSQVRNKCGGNDWAPPNGNAESYLTGLGYCKSWYYTSYSDTDFTKRVGAGYCRYQAIISRDKKLITYRDGPEPNSQPVYFCNGNPDLWLPWGCVVDTIDRWHRAC